jgi:hypothetical protein
VGHLIDRLRDEKHLEPTTLSGLFGPPLSADVVAELDELRRTTPLS